MKSSRRLIKLFCFLIFFAGCASLDRNTPSSKRLVRNEDHATSNSRKDDATPRKRVVVLPFLDASEGRPQSLRDKSRAAFLRDLNRTGDLIALDSNELNLDLSKSLDTKTGEYKLTELMKPAQALGVSSILEGKVLDIRIKRKADNVGLVRNLKSVFEVVVRMRILSVRSGKEVFNTVKTVSLEEENVRVAERVQTDKFIENNPEMIEVLVKDAFLDFTPQILSSLDRIVWEGRIAAISGDRIYLNVGKISGLQIGDLLKVSEEGDDVYDPESGTHIGRVPGRMKGTLEVISYFGTDGAISIIHSGSGFKENDRVETY